MTIEKLKSGSYRIKQMQSGVTYHVTIDHKPTKEEAMRLILKEIDRNSVNIEKSTFEGACNAYIASKDKVLSPSTVVGYRSLIKRLPDSLLKKYMTQITIRDVQSAINQYAADHSPKTVANMSNFIMSVLNFNGIDLRSPKLPQRIKSEPYSPTSEEVQQIIDMAKGTPYEVAYTLAAFGMRRSEIFAATSDKLNGTVLTIDSAIVQDEKGEWVSKTTKTVESTRTIVIPERTADLIRKQGKAYLGSPKMLNQTLTNYQRKLGIRHFPLHKMRHFFASYLHQQGYSDAQIQKMGGWQTDHVMKSVYRHAMDMEDAKRSVADDLGNLL